MGLNKKLYRPIDPSLERSDGLQFKVDDRVKAKIDDKWTYCVILEDNRPNDWCTYTYTLVTPKDLLLSITYEKEVPVYCLYPKDIHPINKLEKLLYYGSK